MHNSEPAQEGTFIEKVAMTSVPQEEMLSVFAGWEEEVQSLLRVCASSRYIDSYVNNYATVYKVPNQMASTGSGPDLKIRRRSHHINGRCSQSI